ncbi:hypothetical protein B0H14DRAFT_3607837, partial [Mycena olivaceomarginata]
KTSRTLERELALVLPPTTGSLFEPTPIFRLTSTATRKAVAAARFSVLATVSEQTERTRGSSISQIKQFIEESDSKMASLETEIALEFESLNIEALSAMYATASAPPVPLYGSSSRPFALPVELLAEIFVLTIREALHIRDAFRVTHVCESWRQIARGTPQLWTGPLNISLSRRADIQENIYANGLREWLARSAPLSVPISLTGWPRSGVWFGGISSRIMDELLRIAPRWRSLRVLQRAPGALVQCFAHNRLEALEELQLQRERREMSMSLTPRPYCPSQPLLASGNSIELDSRILPMPWAQLTDLTLTTGHSAENFLGVFAQCTKLVRVFTSGWSIIPPATGADILVFRHLHVLSITFAGAHRQQGMK